MKVSVTGAQMKAIDNDTISRIGIPSMVLMERAALAVTEAAEQMAKEARLTDRGRAVRVWIACGTGNNGADGIAVGRMLHEKGYEVTVLLAGDLDRATPEHSSQRQIAEHMGVTLVEYGDFIPGTCDLIVDALFGVGLERPVEGEYRELIEMLAAQKTKLVVAVDLPSGIHADTGAVLGVSLQAKVTVTFGYQKTGLLLYPGKSFAGNVITADIGLAGESLSRVGWNTVIPEKKDLSRLPCRQENSHKGTYGRLLVIAGSVGMSGAAYLSSLAAFRTGAGLVKIMTTEANRSILQSQLPEAIVVPYPEELVLEAPELFRQMVEQQCDWATAVVLGPGLGQGEAVRILVETVLSYAYVPIVLDADALNTVSKYPYLTGYYTENIVLTPHMGEMSRLIQKTIPEIKADPVQVARTYGSSYGVTCVLKDAVTIVADKDGGVSLNSSGNSGMAKAGSGDVLTGIIGAFLAQGMEPKEAAVLGVYIHGLAGDEAVGQMGRRSILAGEIPLYISQVLREEDNET